MAADHLERCAIAHKLLAAPDAATAPAAAERGRALAGRIRTEPDLLAAVLAQVDLAPERVGFRLDAEAIAGQLGCSVADLIPDLLFCATSLRLRRRGVETRIVAGDLAAPPDRTLGEALRKAHRWCEALRQGVQLNDLARREKVSDAYLRTRAQIAFLSPKIQAAILAGTQPQELTLERLVRTTIPLDWQEQERLFGPI